MDAVSIMPPDGYTAICQCELCEGKESPELGDRGRLSNYVWDFVNRVAKEVGKTHPNKRISNCAYGVYTEPPSNIDKLEPNVQVIIVGGRRPLQEDREDLRRLRREWAAKTDRQLEIFENYPFTGRGWYLPAFIPKTLGESINETKGQSRGEDIWLTMDVSEKAVGFNHFLLYFTGRMQWGGKDADHVAMFDEYVEKFYGPVAGEMGAFFAFCEENWRKMETDSEIATRALDLFETAKAKAPTDSVFAERIGLIDNFLNGLRNKATQLAQKRGPVPTLRLVSGVEQRGKIVIDGKLDDGPWVKIPTSSTGRLRELQTGGLPTYGTDFKTEWIGSDLYLAIRCQEAPGEKPNSTASEDGDRAIFYGDAVEINIATNRYSYYQITVSPEGAVVDLDRGAPRAQWFRWSAKAEVATRIHDDHWIAEIRLPITQDENDPYHLIVGQKPTVSLPWFINVCRQRIRENGSESTAFSPTGTKGFHDPMKFAHFFSGNSNRFPADETVTDFVIATREADRLLRSRKNEEAQAAFHQLASVEKITDFQKSFALQQAARCAFGMKSYERAGELAGQIPLDSVAKTTQMQVLNAQRKWAEVVEKFSNEDLKVWPFWQVGEAAFERGKAFYMTKTAERAETDLKLALAYEPDPKVKVNIRAMMAHNRETNLSNDIGALELYLANIQGKERIGGAEEFRSVSGAASILSKQGKHEQALAVFEAVNFEKQAGHWLYEMLLARAAASEAAGKTDQAKTDLKKVAADAAASKSQRQRAEEALNSAQ